jgi:putative ABC transport system permease protein
MLNNQLKTAYRQLLRRRSYTIINIAGLAAGIAVCLLIFVYIRFETSYDDFHSKKDRIYRVMYEYHPADGSVSATQQVPQPLPTVLRQEFPQLTSAGIYDNDDNGDVPVLVLGQDGAVEKKFREASGVFSVEPSFFDIFDFPWLEGSPATSLADPHSAVLTKETAEKYFGDWKKAMGRTIELNNSTLLKVTGILATIPANTDFQFKIVTPYTLTGFQNSPSSAWGSTSSDNACYILLPLNVTTTALDARLRAFIEKYRPAGSKDELTLGSLSKAHTYDKTGSNFSRLFVHPEVIRALWLIAAFILLVACVNFVNLSTANSVNRAREVGVRKVLGSNRGQLRRQFLLETLLIVGGAVVLALGLAELALPMMAKIVDLPLSAALLQTPAVLLFLLVLIIVVTLLAGWYPSAVLSRFNPSKVLRAKVAERAAKGISLRRSLVVLQFVIAQALIIGTFVMIRQMEFFRDAPMGFDKDAIINVPFPTDATAYTKLDYVKNRLWALPGVSRVSLYSGTPADDNNTWTNVTIDHAAKPTDFYSIGKFADSNYLGTFKIPLVAGTNFRSADTTVEILVTESFVKHLGIRDPQQALNKTVDFWGKTGPIVGVMGDFHATSMKDGINSVVIRKARSGGYSNAGIKLSGSNIPGTIAAIQKLWNQAFPNYVFQYQFFDQHIADFYRSEQQLSELYQFFAAIAIFLSCLGLYGLASFMAAQRIREIGIRKVLGSSARGIVALFSKEFMVLTGIAFLIAAPVAGWYMDSWLQDYTYHAKLSWWIFAAGGGLSVLVALLTVSLRALRAANANPVQALKTE